MKPRTMRIEAHEVKCELGDERLVFVEYVNAETVKRVSVSLGRWGAEEVAQRLLDLLEGRRKNAQRLEEAMKP